MYLESFRNIIEIESLKSKIREYDAILSGELKRITDLDALRQRHLNRIEELSKVENELHLKTLELTIASEESRLIRLSEQMDLVKNDKELAAITHQLQTLKESMARNEEKYFENLEISENLHQEVKDAKQFLTGSIDTKEEIIKEVESVKSDVNEKIFYLNARINSLLEQCNKSARDLYLSSEKTGVAFINGKVCSKCHMQISSVMKTTVEEGRNLECCPHCGRFLIPETAKIY